MSTMVSRLCSTPGCPNAATRGRCASCTQRHEKARGSYSARGYDANWRTVRREVLRDTPLCTCGAVATEVDHIESMARGGARFARVNLRALCKPCHSAKTAREDGRWLAK